MIHWLNNWLRMKEEWVSVLIKMINSLTCRMRQKRILVLIQWFCILWIVNLSNWLRKNKLTERIHWLTEWELIESEWMKHWPGEREWHKSQVWIHTLTQSITDESQHSYTTLIYFFKMYLSFMDIYENVNTCIFELWSPSWEYEWEEWLSNDLSPIHSPYWLIQKDWIIYKWLSMKEINTRAIFAPACIISFFYFMLIMNLMINLSSLFIQEQILIIWLDSVAYSGA